MALGEDALAAIDELIAVSAQGADAAPFADFRRQFPSLSLTRCDASDMDCETPFRVYSGASLYLVDASDHCWRITSDPARATGIVVARHREA